MSCHWRARFELRVECGVLFPWLCVHENSPSISFGKRWRSSLATPDNTILAYKFSRMSASCFMTLWKETVAVKRLVVGTAGSFTRETQSSNTKSTSFNMQWTCAGKNTRTEGKLSGAAKWQQETFSSDRISSVASSWQKRATARHGKCTSTVDQDVPSGNEPGGLAEVHK